MSLKFKEPTFKTGDIVRLVSVEDAYLFRTPGNYMAMLRRLFRCPEMVQPSLEHSYKVRYVHMRTLLSTLKSPNQYLYTITDSRTDRSYIVPEEALRPNDYIKE